MTIWGNIWYANAIFAQRQRPNNLMNTCTGSQEGGEGGCDVAVLRT